MKLPAPNGGRSIEEWVGSTPDARVPERVKLRIFQRADGRCHLTGRKIAAGEPWDVEHIKPLSMGGTHCESNLAPALREAHRAKSADETSARAKADRIARKRLGLWPEPKRKIPSRPFPKARQG